MADGTPTGPAGAHEPRARRPRERRRCPRGSAARWIVPVDHSRELVARLRGVDADVDYLEVPGADHVWRGAPSVPAIVAESLAFLAKRL